MSAAPILPDPLPRTAIRGPIHGDSDGLLAAYRRRAARRGDNRTRKPARVSYPDPWPIDFDPPTVPYPPGQWPEALRRVWRLWGEAWDDLAADMELESAGLLWQCYNAMLAAGVTFDPAFVRAFEHWRWRAEREFEGDADDDPDEDVCHDSGQDYTCAARLLPDTPLR